MNVIIFIFLTSCCCSASRRNRIKPLIHPAPQHGAKGGNLPEVADWRCSPKKGQHNTTSPTPPPPPPFLNKKTTTTQTTTTTVTTVTTKTTINITNETCTNKQPNKTATRSFVLATKQDPKNVDPLPPSLSRPKQPNNKNNNQQHK